jgi:hypothetical protein
MTTHSSREFTKIYITLPLFDNRIGGCRHTQIPRPVLSVKRFHASTAARVGMDPAHVLVGTVLVTGFMRNVYGRRLIRAA